MNINFIKTFSFLGAVAAAYVQISLGDVVGGAGILAASLSSASLVKARSRHE